MLFRNGFNDRFEFRPSTICSIGDDDDKGGDGGGGGGGDDGKKGLDDETKKFIANTVNSSVASFMKRDSFKSAIAETVNATVGDAVKSALADALPKPGGSGGDDDKSGKLDPRDAEIKKLQSEQEKMRKKMEESAAAAEAEKNKSRTQEERSQLMTALRKSGVDDARIAAAVAFIYLDQKLVRRDENDKVCMVFERDWGEELVPVEKGAAEYLKTDSGKVFLPPIEAGGSGNKGGRPAASRKPGEKPTRSELMAHLGNQMLHGGQVPGSR